MPIRYSSQSILCGLHWESKDVLNVAVLFKNYLYVLLNYYYKRCDFVNNL